jgi:hypothetical protein
MWCNPSQPFRDLTTLLTPSSCPFISIGVLHAKNLAVQWRLPLAFACLGPLALLVGLCFVPGSQKPFACAYLDT